MPVARPTRTAVAPEALISVTVPTLERGPPPSGFWSTTTARPRCSTASTSGCRTGGRNARTNRLKWSWSWRCASAPMVSKTSDDLPEPDTPVTTVMARLGMLSDTSLRLCSRAPRTSMDPFTRRRPRGGCAWAGLHGGSAGRHPGRWCHAGRRPSGSRGVPCGVAPLRWPEVSDPHTPGSARAPARPYHPPCPATRTRSSPCSA